MRTDGATINGEEATFGVYNLNPYVWFIHRKLDMSGYGFSLDDDTANAQDATDSMQIAYGGTMATGPLTTHQQLANLELYTYGAPFGRLQDQGYIDVTSGFAKGYDLKTHTVISGLSLETVGRLNAFDEKQGQGALVTGFGMTPGSSRVFLVAQENPVNGANASHVVLLQPSPEQDGPTSTYTFAGFSTTLPVINALSSVSGPVGTEVTITGSGFTNAKGVTFNGVPATIPHKQADSDTSITVTVPAGATTGRIGVRGLAGTGYSNIDFTVTDRGAPTITSLDRTNGSLLTVVTLTGTGFTGVTAVRFNGGPGIDATQFEATSDTTLKVVVPIGATATGSFTVTTADGSGSSVETFTVDAPKISSFSPASGPVGTVFTLTGSAFTGATEVRFGSTSATNFTVLDDSTIQVTLPRLATTGPIAVINSAGTGTSATDVIVDATFRIAVFAGDQQSSVASTAFASPLQARVTDAFGNPVGGVGRHVRRAGQRCQRHVRRRQSPARPSSPTPAASPRPPSSRRTLRSAPTRSRPTSARRGGAGQLHPDEPHRHEPHRDQQFVNALYVAFLGRPGSLPEWSGWVAALPSIGRDGVVNGIMRSVEACTRVVDALYLRLLDRSPAGGEQAGWVNALVSRTLTEEQVIAGIVASPEFAARAQRLFPGAPSDTAFVEALYTLLLNRPSDAAGLANCVNALPSVGRAGVASGLVGSAEFRAGAVRTFYGDPTLTPPYQPFFVDLLNRSGPPSAVEVSGWVNRATGPPEYPGRFRVERGVLPDDHAVGEDPSERTGEERSDPRRLPGFRRVLHQRNSLTSRPRGGTIQ